MNAIYNCCFADPWVDVAKILKDKYNIQPIYWIGYDDDHSRDIIPSMFPETIYHEYFSAWKGVFPKEIEDKAAEYPVDINFYQEISKFELQGLNLMDRMDPDQKSFGFSERRNLFRKFLRYWKAIIEHYQIELLISPVMPHRSFDFPLYLICKQKGIKIIGFVSTPFSSAGRIIRVNDLYSISSKIKEKYEQMCANPTDFHLADDIQTNLDLVRKNYEEAKPENFKEFYRFHKKKPSMIQTVRKFLYELSTKSTTWFGRDGYLIKGVPTYHKTRKKDVEKSKTRLNLIQYSYKIYKRICYLKMLQKEYSKISEEPDLTKPYVVFALHYQPEATSAPRADVFADQLYILELLSKYLPLEWNIYIKENPMQFNPRAEGNTGRLLRFYRDALRFPRVSFVPVESIPFALIDSSKAVITVTGTIGWEGLVREKPVICFGPSWYEFFKDGVLRVRDTGDLGKMADFVRNYEYSESKLFSYLKAIEHNSICAYFRRGLKDVMDINESQCVNDLVNSITEHFKLFPSSE